MSHTAHARVVIGLLIATVGVPTVAVGEPASPGAVPAPETADLVIAKRHFADGERLFAHGAYADAARAYEAAYRRTPLPEFLFNMAQCHRQLGNRDRAILLYRAYLDRSQTARNRAYVERTISELNIERSANDRLARALQASARSVPSPLEQSPGRPARDARPSHRWWYVAGASAAVVAAAVAVIAWPRSELPAGDLEGLDFRR